MRNLRDTLNFRLSYVNQRINDFNETEKFDPFSLMNGTETKKQKLFRADVELLTALEKAIEEHDKAQKECL